jgi:1-acyl-sn-glycerol-3-phosphate acyltransferase
MKIKIFIAWFIWRLTYAIKNLFLVFTKLHVVYEDNKFNGIRKPLILISNHQGIFDPWYISFAIPFRVLFDEIYPLRVFSSVKMSEKNAVGKIFKAVGLMRLAYYSYNSIEVPNAGTLEEKIAPLVEAINNNESVLIFPEGGLALSESVREFKKGVIKLHKITRAPIVPISIRYKKRKFPFFDIYISIGKVFSIPQGLLNEVADKEFLEARTLLRNTVVQLYNNNQ